MQTFQLTYPLIISPLFLSIALFQNLDAYQSRGFGRWYAGWDVRF